MEEKVMGKVLKFGVFIASVLLFVAMPGCKSDDEPGGDGVRKELSFTPDERAAIDAFNEVGLSIMRQPGILSEVNNLVVSPVSLVPAIAMYANGLDQAGQSRVINAFGLDGESLSDVNKVIDRLCRELPQSDKRNKLNIANGFWVNEGVELTADYKSALQNDLNATVKTAKLGDQSAKTEIDNWCSKNTSGMITDVFNPSKWMSFFLANAVYFDGKWKKQFNENSTRQGKFHNYDATESDVWLMRADINCAYYKGENYAMARLPYMCDSYYAIIILPDAGISLASVVNSLSTEDITKFAGNSLNECKVDVMLPKVDFGQAKVELTDALFNMGILSDDSKLVGFPEYDNVIPNFDQFTSLVINEKGTKAVVVTSGVFVLDGSLEPVLFKVDRPYLFMVVHNDSKAIIVEALINKL